MKKLDRFLLAENPMVNGSVAIVHTIDPISIIGLIEGHAQHAQPFRHYSFINVDGLEEEWTLYIHHMFTTNMGATDEAVKEEMLDRVMNRAWHWYKAYIDWEDAK